MAAAPHLIHFKQFGSPAEGYITTTQFASNIPFEVKRIFWVQDVPEKTIRGQHANKLTEEVLVALHGVIKVKTESKQGEQLFELDSPDLGLYIPSLCWTELVFEQDATGLCLASTDFDESDYIRNYSVFKQLLINQK